MKRWILALISVVTLLGLTACTPVPEIKETEGTEPTTKIPEETYDLVYDMQSYDFFSSIFDEKPLEQWTSMGRYTMLLKGLHTPVAVTMDGTDVLTVSAHDQTVELGEAGRADDYHDGLSPVYYISSTPEAVVIRVSGGECYDSSILITETRCYPSEQMTDGNTNFYVREDGILEYYRVWHDPIGFEQMGYNALECYTSRDEPLYETGRVEIAKDDLVLSAEKTVLLSDEFDLDALFAEAKEAGMFEEYDSLDILFAANQARVDES